MNGDFTHFTILYSRTHQRVVTELIYALTKLYKEGKSKLFPLPETMIDAGQTSPVPDVLLIDRETELAKVIIEITHTQGVKKDLQKLRTLMQDYEVPEGFVYDYKQNRWYKYSLSAGQKQGDSYSELLQGDLSTMLDPNFSI